MPRSNQTYRVARGDGTAITRDAVSWLLKEGINGLMLGPDDLQASGAAGLDWLDQLPSLRMLEVFGRRIPSIPAEVLERLTIFSRVGSGADIQTSALKDVEELVFSPARQLVGPLRRCARLASVHLGSFADDDLAIVDGCQELTDLHIEGRGQGLTLRWECPPPSLEYLQLHRAHLESLDGLGALSHLRVLRVERSKAPEVRPLLDFAHLAGCTELTCVVFTKAGDGINIDTARSSLPRIVTFGVS